MPTSWPLVFMGTPQIAAATLERVLEGPDHVVGVVTQPDRPSGRGQNTAPSPVRRLAEARGIPVVGPEKIRTPEFLETLRRWEPQIIVVVAYGRILPKTILELAPHGCLNVHYSLLPKYRGAAPAAWTIINGETEGGVTTMKLVEKMDAGAIYLQEAIPLAADETSGSLQANITPVGIGDWSERDFVRALREHKRPNGSTISDAMPRAYGQMTDDDLEKIYAYLKTVPRKGEKTKSQLAFATR